MHIMTILLSRLPQATRFMCFERDRVGPSEAGSSRAEEEYVEMRNDTKELMHHDRIFEIG